MPSGVRLAAALAVISLIVAGCSSGTGGQLKGAGASAGESSTSAETPGATQNPQEPSPTPSTYDALLTSDQLTTAAVCAAFDQKIKKYATTARTRAASGRKATRDPYVAAAYRRGHDWLRDPLTDKFENSLRATATTSLNELSGGRAGQVESVDPYLRDALAACGLTKAVASARKLVKQSDGVGERIRTKAASKPWYPRGYDEYEDGIAMRWVDSAGNDCYECSYWTADVIPRDGCSDSLYVELSVEDRSGAVIGYTNDSVGSVRPGQRARMSFETYDDSASSGRVSEISCY